MHSASAGLVPKPLQTLSTTTTAFPSNPRPFHLRSPSFLLTTRRPCRVVKMSAKSERIPIDDYQLVDRNASVSNDEGVSGVATNTQTSKVSGNFERLKIQKVKTLVRKASSKSTLSKTESDGRGQSTSLGKSREKYTRIPEQACGSLNAQEPMLKPSSSRRAWEGGSSVQSSRSWMKQQKQMSSDSGFFSRKSFEKLGCADYMVECLRSQMFIRPSHIQAMSYEPVLQGKTCIIADQSGSGKTLAYLAPIIQRLRQREVTGLGTSSPRAPSIVILVPTAELASQVLTICRFMARSGVPFRSMIATGGFHQKTQIEGLEQDLDVLVATPGRFHYLLQEGFLLLTNLQCVVLDEVDILFADEEFEQVLGKLVSSAPVTAQYLFVTATLPVNIYNKLVEVYPDCEVIMGPGVHRTSSGLEEILVDCSGDIAEEKNPDTAFQNKRSALLQIVEGSPVSKTIIFCNKIETCRKVENTLKRTDRKELQLKVLPFHAALAQELRNSNMKEFLKDSHSKDSLFLICTDRASRGIDFRNVDHVILFDLPRDPSEYVRRVGRTARGAGGKGKAYIFAVGKQVSLARRIIERNRNGHPLHDVPSAY